VQKWSASMPSWIWILQLLLTVPIVLMLVAPLALLLTSALHQTGQDGNPQLFVYLCIASLTVVLFMPMLPFIHRYTYHIPIFLLFVLIGTLIYNLVAFPFSDANRVKLYFSQQVDLDLGNSTAYLTGMLPFVEDVVRGLPSASGQTDCVWNDALSRSQCSWTGPEPHVVTSEYVSSNSSSPSSEWVFFNTESTGKSSVRFEISGQNTRSCRITMDGQPVTNFNVRGGSEPDHRFLHPSQDGIHEIRLWSRTWQNKWTVDVNFSEKENDTTTADATSITGRVSCIWSDNNTPGLIPALDELRKYAPSWAAVTKLTDGLVEGYRKFELKRTSSGELQRTNSL